VNDRDTSVLVTAGAAPGIPAGGVPRSAWVTAIAAMVAVVVSSNILVQYPVQATIGGLDLADLLTWGAFTYPAAFLVTDLTNRRFGVAVARRVIVVGFLMAVVLSVALATPRIAIASATAFLVGQLLDVTVFDRLRRSGWWKAPFVGSLLGSATDTTVFFSLAFAGIFGFLGAADPFSAESATLLGTAGVEAARWVSWALADFSVKLAFAALFLVPYRLVMNLLWPIPDRMATAA
jgi:uncharacterized PurR-regulated membrane protein YhhQ (DUF165 family)